MAAKKKAKKRSKRPTGRPPFVPTQEQRDIVSLMIAYGINYEEIAAHVINPKTGKGISTTTFQIHFKHETKTAKALVEAKLATSLFKRATDHKHSQGAIAAMFMLKTKFGWREKVSIELEGTAAGVLVAPAMVSPDDWLKMTAKPVKKKDPE